MTCCIDWETRKVAAGPQRRWAVAEADEPEQEVVAERAGATAPYRWWESDEALVDAEQEQRAVEIEAKAALSAALLTLPPRSERILRAIFGINCEARSLGELSNELDISRGRVRQVAAQAMRTLLYKANGLRDQLYWRDSGTAAHLTRDEIQSISRDYLSRLEIIRAPVRPPATQVKATEAERQDAERRGRLAYMARRVWELQAARVSRLP